MLSCVFDAPQEHMGRRKKRKRAPTYCICDATGNIIETGTQRDMKRLKDEYEACSLDNLTLDTMERVEEEKRRKKREREERQRLQNEVYDKARMVDMEKERQREQKNRLRMYPEERAMLYDSLFKKKNPHYKPVLERVKSHRTFLRNANK